jgi:peroxiredoxin
MSITGDQVSSDAGYGEKTRVLLFVHDLYCHTCLSFLRSFRSRLTDYLSQGASVYVIFPESTESRVEFDLPIMNGIDYLADNNHEVREAYVKLMTPGLVSPRAVLFFVLDSFGAPYVCLSADEPSLDAHQDLLGWLQYISIQCPE